MSTSEYNNLIANAQLYGVYHMFVFDIVESKKMLSAERQVAQEKMIQLMLSIYNSIKIIEENNSSKILVMEQDFNSYEANLTFEGFGMKTEPFILGDAFGFTIYRNTLSNEIIMDLFNYYCEKLSINFKFHIAHGFYETNDYALGVGKYFRGYCLDFLTNSSKEQYRKVLQKQYEKNGN